MANISVTLLPLSDVHMGPRIELADGSPFPARFEAMASVGDASLYLWIVVEDGRPVLDAAQFSRARDTPGQLRTLSPRELDEVVQQAIRAMGRYMEEDAGIKRPSGVSAVRAHRHRAITDDLLREVAAVVLADLDGKPNRAVTGHFGVSSRTASRWITAAEKYITEED